MRISDLDLPDMVKVDRKRLATYCEKAGIQFDSRRIELTVLALVQTMTKAESLATCENCGGDSDSNLEECPYCVPPPNDEAQTTQTKSDDMAKKTSKKVAPKASTKKKGETTALATVSHIVTDKALQAGMDKVRTLQREGVEVAWEIGKELFNLYENKLWTQMQDDKGKPVYKDWSTFVSKEFGIVSAYAFKLMDVASHFSKKQISEVGVTKLAMIVRVPEQQRAQLLEAAKNTPRSKIAEEVSKLAGTNVRDTGRKKFSGQSGKGRGAGAAEKSVKLTVVRTKPKLTVPLFKADSTHRAKSAADAVGVEKCANGVSVYYSIKNTEAGLALVIETVRETEKAVAAE